MKNFHYIIQKINDAQISEDPFPHIYIENFFDDNGFPKSRNPEEVFICLKYWKKEEDFVLSNLSKMILNRNILKIKVQKILQLCAFCIDNPDKIY